MTAKGAPLLPDVEADLRALPFPNDYADEARAIHVIEHFYVWEAPKVVAEWVRVLKPGAQLIVECPSLNKILRLFDIPHVEPHYTYWGLYGDPRLQDPLMCHKWAYTEAALASLMEKCGLVDVHGERPQFHQAIRDMRLVGTKPVPPSRIALAH